MALFLALTLVVAVIVMLALVILWPDVKDGIRHWWPGRLPV